MPRIRTIKPEFWTSEQVADCSTTARLLFIGLWNWCDDSGVHPGSIRRAKMEVFPGDDFSLEEIEGWIAELVDAELLISYVVDDKEYWRVSGWKHQRIEKPNFRYPLESGRIPGEDHSETSRRPLDDRSPPEGKGRDSSSTSPNGTKNGTVNGTRFGEFWTLYPRKEAKAKAEKTWNNMKVGDREKAIASLPSWPFPADRQYQPLPSSWLNQRRWEDEGQTSTDPMESNGVIL